MVACAGSVARFMGSATAVAASRFRNTAVQKQLKGAFSSKSSGVRASRARMATSAAASTFFDFSATTLGSGTRDKPVTG